jgi:hypothetical protein
MDDRLRRNAAADEAGAAELVGFDQGGVETELTSTYGGNVTTGATSDDENFGVKGFAHDLSIVVPFGTRVAFLDFQVQRSAPADYADSFCSIRVHDWLINMLRVLKDFPVITLVIHQNIVRGFDWIVPNASDRFV